MQGALYQFKGIIVNENLRQTLILFIRFLFSLVNLRFSVNRRKVQKIEKITKTVNWIPILSGISIRVRIFHKRKKKSPKKI